MKKTLIVKCLGILLAANLFTASAEAAQINTIVDTGSGMFAEPEKVYAKIDSTLKVGFSLRRKTRKR